MLVVSYTTVSPLLICMSGLFSVALIPRIAPGGRYPPPCSLESGLSSVLTQRGDPGDSSVDKGYLGSNLSHHADFVASERRKERTLTLKET